ncbi:M23 family metallopeptidase [Alkalihalobacillus sp. CinArs1]|uniref:M23 family metallopeptidase n=1 Tax=Alkalihalobacillus sp. CinArs1 TaxID=2995314 RepID=UPI0022DE2857|nr:M23 family metallopeptidase [Alkalihalobacillus sp. CinArs1]
MATPKVVKRICQSAVLVSLISVSMVTGIEPAGATVYNMMKPVYHVYIDGSNIGTIDDKEQLKEQVDKIKEEKQTGELTLMVENDLQIVPKRLFQPSYDNEETLDKVADELTFVAKGYELSFENESVGIFSSESSAKDALWVYAKPFLSDDKVKEIESKIDEDNEKHPADYLELSSDLFIEEVEAKKHNVLTEEEGVTQIEDGYLKEVEIEVSEDETLADLADEYDMEEAEIRELNDLAEDDKLESDKVTVLEEKQFVKVLETEEVTKDEEIDFDTETTKSDSLLKGKKDVTQTGEKGEKKVTYSISRENGEITNKEIIKEEVTKEPVKEKVTIGTKEIPSKGTGSFAWPAVGGTITSKQGERWGSFHKGIDIAGVSDRTIKTVDNGTVTAAGKRSGYGNQVTINHNNGMKTTYAHLSSISVSVGDTVQKGDKIGVMGTTGKSTGVHLHLEVYKNGKLENPMDYL